MRHFLTLRHGGWAIFALWLLCIPLGLKSQQFCNIDTTSFTPGAITHSCFGAAHTPQRSLHILVVFVRYEVNQASYDTIQWPDNPTLPQFAQDALGLPGFNQLFASDTNQIKNHPNFQNLSQCDYQMSDEKFLLAGLKITPHTTPSLPPHTDLLLPR